MIPEMKNPMLNPTRPSELKIMKPVLLIVALLCWLPVRSASQETLTIERAVTTALELNQSLRGAQHDLESTGWGKKNAYSNFLPRVTVDAGLTRIDPETDQRANAALDFIRASAGALGIPSSMLANLKPFSYRDTYSTGVTIVQPVYNGGAEIVGVKAANALEEKSEYSYKDTEQDVIARVRTSYYNVLSAQELVSLMRESMERTKRYVETTRRREELGMRTRTDVARWEVQLASDEGSLIKAENLLSLARLQLNEVMGVDLNREYTLAPVVDAADTVSATAAGSGPLLASLGGMPAEPQLSFADLELHPSWQAMDANLRLAETGVDRSWTAFQPRVNVAFQYGWERNSTLRLDGYKPWALALSVSFPIFNGFGDYANLQRAREDYDRAQSQVASFRRGLLLQATNARLNVRAARQRIEVARKAQQQALDVLNAVTRRYETGGASNVDLIDVQTAYTSAKVNFITSLYDYYVANVQLARATGTITL